MRTIRGRIEPMGPFLDATVMATPPHIARLKALSRAAPGAVSVRTLVDTGASACVLDFSVISRLGLIQTGRTKVHTSTTGPGYEDRDLFDASIFLGTLPGQTASYTVSVVGSDLASEGFLAIIGWDILRKCVVTCHGPSRVFKLKY